MKTKRICIISMLLSVAIILNIIESFIPVFIPGVKLGLANVIILIMLYEFKSYEAFFVNLLRIFLVSFLRGNFLSPTFMMSLSGGMVSFFVMYLFSKIKVFSPIGVSVLGAFSHAVGQVFIAGIILGTEAIIYYLPFIGILSILTGIFSGCIVHEYLKKSITQRFLY